MFFHLPQATRAPEVRLRARASSFLLLTASLLWLVAPVRAEEPQASGFFETATGRFPVVGAYAFPDEVGLDDEPGIRVAISNVRFASAFVDHYWDRRYAIDNFFADSETAVVYLHFDPKGRYRGLSYYFGPGDGCGYCFDSETQAQVDVRGEKIVGSLRQDGEDRRFEVRFDVPIATTDFGEPLPADGGGPGAVYRSYHEALTASDPVRLRPLLSADRHQHLDGDAPRFMNWLQQSHPEDGKIVRGFATKDRALLLVEGKIPYVGKVQTEVYLLLEGDAWRVDDEIAQQIVD